MTLSRLLLAISATAVAALPSPVALAQSIDAEHSSISFVSQQMGVPIEGKFDSFSGSVRFDPQAPDKAHAEIDVALTSIDAGSEDATSEVRRKPWFHVSAFPTAHFVANGATAADDGRYRTQGKLTIKGITKTVTVEFTARRTAAGLAYDGDFTLLRLDFNIGTGSWSDTDTVANEVKVKFHLVQAGSS